MADDLEHFRQSPQKFRMQIWAWISDPYRGGEIGQIISRWFKKPKKLFIKGLKTRVGQGIIVLLALSGIVILLKKQPGQPIQSIPELIFDNSQSIAVVFATILFVLESSDRRKRDHYEAWQVINSAIGQSGSGGRIQALEDLNNDDVDLGGLAVPNADLSGIRLKNGKLNRANIQKSQLHNADLRNTVLCAARAISF